MSAMLRRSAFLSASLCASTAVADPPPPKVCVAVAGDPDEAVRSLASDVAERVAAGPATRGVADADIRAALRGESNVADDQADRARSRRSLRGNDGDAATLDALAEPLGCAWFVTVAASPSGARVRAYDVVHHRFGGNGDAADAESAVGVLRTAMTAGTESSTNAAASAAAQRQGATAPTRRENASGLTFSRMWPWLVAGGVALGVIAAFVLLQSEDAPSTTVTVIHRGAQ